MSLRIREINNELLPDLLNIDEITIPNLQTALRGPNKTGIWAKLQQETLAAGQSGKGVEFDNIPDPVTQEGLQCQTMALVNGIRAVGEGYRLTTTGFEIRGIVKNVRDTVHKAGTSGKLGIYSTDTQAPTTTNIADLQTSNIVAELRKTGIPLDLVNPTGMNPVQIAKALFQPKRFMGAGQNAHEVTIVPLTDATTDKFVARLDSLEGTRKTISLDKFLHILLDGIPEDKFLGVYEVRQEGIVYHLDQFHHIPETEQ